MKREAFKMYLKPGCEAEYERRHAAIWPEMKALLAKNGVFDYSIYWDKMADIMEVNPDNSPVSIPLKEVFHMD